MAIPWMVALKVIPWGDVIEHAPTVLKGAKKLLDRQRQGPTPPGSDPAGVPATNESARWAELQAEQRRLQADVTQLAQTATELAEQNARLVEAVEVLRWRTRWLGAVSVALIVAVLVLFIRA